MKKIFTIIFLLASGYLYAQPFATGKRTEIFVDNLRSGREISTDLYYPANTAGNNVPLATGVTKFPVVVFGHGFLINSNAYRWLADSLVKNGYVVAFPNTEDGILPSHLDFGLDLSFLSTRISSLNDSASSFLYQRLIKRVAVAGHSMGGGASFLAAATQNNSIKALFNFAAAETTPSATAAAVLNFKPTLIFSGSSDCVVPDSVQNAMYNNIFLACKTYVNITNALHCQFANNNLICQAGQIVAGCGFTSLSTQTVLSKTTALLLPFLDYYLKDNCIRGDVFVNTYNTMTGITKRRSCLPFPTCGVVPVKLIGFSGKTNDQINNLYWNTASEENFSHFEVERSNDGSTYNSFARVNSKGSFGRGATYSLIDAYPFAGYSFYRLKMIDKDGSFSYSDIVRLETSRKSVALTMLYPNPVKDQLNIQIQSDKSQSLSVSLTDMSGKLIMSNTLNVSTGLNNRMLNLNQLASGIYLLQYKNAEGFNTGTFKIVKQ
jgi:dienelactone hydrolase